MTQSSASVVDPTALMQRLMLEMVLALVDQPEDVRVELFDDNGTSLIRVQVARQDIGKVIGKQGRTARSLRTIMGAVSMKYQQRFALDIVEG